MNIKEEEMKISQTYRAALIATHNINSAVALNIFTNYFNHIAGTKIDFPVVKTTAAR